MFRKDIFLLHFNSCLSSIKGRITDYFNTLDELKTITELLFTVSEYKEIDIDEWITEKSFSEDEDGFWQPINELKAYRMGEISESVVSYFWQAEKKDKPEIRRRLFALRDIGTILKKKRSNLEGAAWIYYQDIENVSIQYPFIDQITAIDSDFNWLEYHTFKSVAPDVNPEREIRSTSPTIDYAGEGLIISLSIPVYVQDRFTGLWSIDVPVNNLFSEEMFESLEEYHRYLLTNSKGEILVGSSIREAPVEEKGMTVYKKLESLGGDFEDSIFSTMGKESNCRIIKNYDNEEIIVYVGYLKQLDWYLFQLFPLNHYMKFVEINAAKVLNFDESSDKYSLNELIRTNTMFSVYNNIVSNLKEETNKKRSITDRLSDRNEEFRLITQLPGQITYNYNIRTGEIEWTGDIKGVTGYEDVEFNNYSISDWSSKLHPEDKIKTIDLLDAAISDEKKFDCVYRFRRKDDTYVNIEDMGFCVIRQETKEKIMLGIMRDVSERIKTENELKQSEERLRALYENAPLAYQSLDKDGNLIDVNPAWKKALGYENSEVLGKNFSHFLHNEWKNHFEKNFPAFKKRGYINGVEFKIRHKDGHFLDIAFDGIVGKNHDGSFRQTYCVFKDITERKRIEEAIDKRIIALTEPLTETGNLTFDLLFDITEIQKLQDEFSKAYGVASVILDPSGNAITKPSNMQNLCNKLIERSGRSSSNCLRFANEITERTDNSPGIKRCPVSNLLDAGTKIMIQDKHIATWLIGQVKDKILTDDELRQLAAANQVDPDEFIIAYNELPDISTENFTYLANLMHTLAGQISQKAFQNIQQARMISHLNETKKLLKHYEVIVSNSTDMVALIDKDFTYAVVNKQYASVFKLKEQDFKDISLFSVHDDIMFTDKLRSNILKSMSGEVCEFRIELEYTSKMVLDFTVSSYRNDVGDIAGAVIVARNVTMKVQSEELLRKLSKAVTQSPSIILITDKQGLIEYVNPKFTEITGFDIDEMKGKTPDFLRPGNENDEIFDEMHKCILSGRIWQGELQTRNKNGDLLWTLSNASPVFDENWNVTNYLNVAEDITKTKAAEKLKASLTQQLNHHTKMEALGQLAGGVAHDFNNMLSGIMGSVQLLKSPKRNLDDKSRNLLGMIQQLTVRAADLTSKLLAFSRDEESQSKALNIHQVIVDTVSILKNTNVKMINIEILPEAEDDIISGHSSAIQNALMNLCINSSHAVDESGHIKISTNNVVLDDHYCENSPFDIEAGRYIEIKVVDNGKGISPENLSRIFEPFFTTKNKDEGTGLGLAIVYSTVIEHRGSIEIESEIGKGTNVKIMLPCSINKIDTDTETQIIPQGKGTILLVDDEYSIRVTGRFILEELGYKVYLAEDGTDGVELFMEKKDEIDLVILDMIMPKMNGSEAFTKIKSIKSDVPIILSSGYTTINNLEELTSKGLEAYIKKPYQTHELSAILTKLIKK